MGSQARLHRTQLDSSHRKLLDLVSQFANEGGFANYIFYKLN